MESKYLKYPSSIKALIVEIKKLCDDYTNKKITENEVKEFIDCWIYYFGENFYFNGEFNPTVKARIGSKRMKLIKSIIETGN